MIAEALRAPPQEHKYWEESFRVYEKGTALFKYPHVRDIWLAYLQQFVARYGGTKLERARDLFKQALSQVRTHAWRPGMLLRVGQRSRSQQWIWLLFRKGQADIIWQ